MPRRTKQSFYPKDRASSKLIDFRRRDIICTASDYNNDASTTDFPYIQLVEYEPSLSNLVAQIEYIKDHTYPNDNTNIYNGLYIAKPTGFTYVLPYYSEYHHQISQGWEEMQGTGIEVLDAAVNLAITLTKVTQPAAGWLYPKSYTGPNETTYSVSFDLINSVSRSGSTTIDLGSNLGSQSIAYLEDVAGKNKRFLERLIHQNLASISKGTSVVPPCWYEIYIPGVRWSPASIIQGIQVTNKGVMNNWNNYVVPDAWEITLQVRELIAESQNLFDEAILGRASAKDMTIHVFKDLLSSPEIGEADEIVTARTGALRAGMSAGAGATPGAGAPFATAYGAQLEAERRKRWGK